MDAMDVVFNWLFLTVAAYEFSAIFAKKRDWTISGHSWDARDYLWGRIVVDVLIFWLVWHIVIDDTFFVQGPSWVDLIVVAVGVAWAIWSFHWEEKRQVRKET